MKNPLELLITCFFTLTKSAQNLKVIAYKLFKSDYLQIIACLYKKLIFYCINTSYPMDNCYSGRRRPARQMSEKDVLCFHRPAGP